MRNMCETKQLEDARMPEEPGLKVCGQKIQQLAETGTPGSGRSN